MIFGFVAAAYSAFAYHKPQLPRIPIGIGILFVAWIGFSYGVYYRYNSNGSREVSYPPPPQSLNNTDNSQVRWASKQIPSEKEGAKFQTELVGETDKVISNGLGVSLNCDNDLIAGTVAEGSQFGPGTDFGVDRQNRRRFYLVFHSRFPAFGPGHPLEIRLWSTHPLSCKSEIALF
jgi:hypothetical protein